MGELKKLGAVLREIRRLGVTRRALLDARLRSRGRLDVSVDFLRAETQGRHYDDPSACRVLSARLDAWRPLATEAKDARQLASGWSSTFLALLSGLGWPGERTLDSEDYQTLQKLRELVSGLSMLDPVLGALRYDDALHWLIHLCADTMFQPETDDVPIQVLVAREIDLAHAARAERFQDPIVGEGGSDHVNERPCL
jgi:hypothetical protein